MIVSQPLPSKQDYFKIYIKYKLVGVEKVKEEANTKQFNILSQCLFS